ncbi:uncharacterized protein LOC114290810 [Camellia sinensis]|uniref:uncharacterized protein LOC114290810 n=1 Tax=Camellia sinensis TaxID=4442 RepID=UPI00103558AF|nr:uncharacterized protein LOC114290810 [Camellia sinensis]
MSVLFLSFAVLPQPPKNFHQSFYPNKDLKKLLNLPIHKRKAPLLLNFIPTYRSALSDVPRRKKKSLSPPSATTPQTASTSRTDQGSTSDPAEQLSTSAPYLVPISQRRRRRRTVSTAEMGRPKPVAKDLLACIPSSVNDQPTQTQPPSKPKRIKKTQPKAKVSQVESEDTLPISKLAESDKPQPSAGKRRSETQPSESPKSKKPKSSSATTSGSKKPAAPWAPKITLEDKPVIANDSAEDINIGVALSTALLLPGDLERNAELSEYKNYALMLQRSVQAIQHAHSFSVQSFENRQKLVDMKREFSSLQKTNKGLQSKTKKIEDQAEAAIKAQTNAEERAEAAEAIRKVAKSQKREAEEKMVQVEKELQEALAIKEAETKDADEKAYAQGMTDVIDAYEQQVKEACNKGFTLG